MTEQSCKAEGCKREPRGTEEVHDLFSARFCSQACERKYEESDEPRITAQKASKGVLR